MTDTLDEARTNIEAQRTPATDEVARTQDQTNPRLSDQLSCARVRVGQWDDYGVRAVVNEPERYGIVQLQVPTGLPPAWAKELAEFATQHIPYTDRDREWDSVSNGGVTSNSDLRNCFVDSMLEAISFATNAVEHAVWAHARGEEWDWPYPVPGRVEAKYERWGDNHPLTYNYWDDEYVEAPVAEHGALRPPTEDDIEF